MKVALVCGAWPPARCGVGDYSEALALALEHQGAAVDRIAASAIGSLPNIVDRLRKSNADILHVQYPSAGYGRSLLPALLPLVAGRLKVVVTLHEFSIFRLYRLPWFMPFAYAADAVILTSETERRSFLRRLPFRRARISIINIGSNIPRGSAPSRDPHSVCYFGLFMPGKGLEDFLAFAQALRTADGAWTIRLIGAPAPGRETYAAGIVDRARQLGIELILNQQPQTVGDRLSQTSFAYLPGPGGITERRGAVLAALENAVLVLGPIGPEAPSWLRDCVIDTPTPHDAVQAITALASNARTVRAAAETRWDSIARRHLALYQDVLRGAPA